MAEHPDITRQANLLELLEARHPSYFRPRR